MKKVYYICHCGSGTTVFENLIELVKEEGNKLLFHINTYDWDLNKVRTITLRAKRVKVTDWDGNMVDRIDFRSSKEQFRYSFIREYEIEDDVVPEKSIIR